MDTLPIGIDYTAAVHQKAGIGRSVRELVRALVEQQPNAAIRLFVASAPRDRKLPPAPGGAGYRPTSLSERTFQRLWHRLRLRLPVELWTGRIGLFHATDFVLPPTRKHTRTVVTVHDLAFERYPDETMPGMLGFLKRTVPRSAREADRVIAVSEATRQDLIELYGIPQDRIAVIHHGVRSVFSPQPEPGEVERLRARYKIPSGPLVLTVGTLQPRKNHLRLVQAFAQIKEPATLVIAGPPGWSYADVRDEVVRLKIHKRVCFAEWVYDEDLPALYRMATVFVFPSLCEGFGLPILEAMASGVPVIASQVSSMPEVVGDAGVLIDPLDIDDMAQAIDALLADRNRRDELCRTGTARAQQFTWAAAAEKTWAIYQSLMH